MARRLRPVGLDFVETAPLRLVFAREVTASPEAVFHALAEDVSGWSEWFSAVTLARPTQDGAGREVRLRGGTRFEETVLAARAPEVYAYRVDVTNAPGARALVEEWRLTPAGKGTRVQWTFATDGAVPFRLALKLGRAGLGRAFRDAVMALDRRLASTHA
ncbi:SRPBCC family protein [Streptomyces sp. NBC_01236]|uniref:SRPBCC family protein n=1 Tax=Streptomyces sp. NBC_01236 TaxID=2903789 RepID=UPI002E0E0635|nr:SRPBCC family protein [Streptomyces sp. NBC_01236]